MIPSPRTARIVSKNTVVIIFFSLICTGSVVGAFAEEWPSESSRLAEYVQESDRIMTGMVTDKEVFGDFEDVWISVYEWLKNGDNANQIILRIKGSATDRELDLDTGEEVLLMLDEIDLERGYFGLHRIGSDKPSKYPIAMRNDVLTLVEKLSENKTSTQKEEEELQRLLNQSGSENCSIMGIKWTDGGRDDKFFYCTYEDQSERFYVPISVTLTHVKQELLKHVSDQYFDEHFNLRRAWDEAVVNGKAEPVGQTLEFEYVLGNFTFGYNVRVGLGYEEDDKNILYMSYFPPEEITQSAIQDRNHIDEIIYSSSCLESGTPYVLYDPGAVSQADSGFSPVIGGRGPPDVFDRYGNQIREADKRFQIWFDTGEIQCTSNVKQEDDIDKNIGRQDRIVLMDASDYVKGTDSKPVSDVNINPDGQQFPLIIGIGAAVVGIIAFLTLRKRKNQ